MSKIYGNRRILLVTLLVLLFCSSPSFALFTIGHRPADATIDFTSFADFSTIANPFSLPFAGGIATFSMPGGDFAKRTQSTGGWAGDFAPGDALLWTNNNPGPMDITFSIGISEFATQIQADYYGTGLVSISAYDASNVLLGSFSLESVSTANADDSAVLLGVSISPGQNSIARISLDISGFPATDFAINDISFRPIPAPGAILLGSIGVGLVSWLRRRRTL